MPAFTLALLKTELTTDPRGYAYNAAGRNDSDILARVNAVRDGTNPGTTPTAGGGAANGIIQVNNATVDTAMIRAVVTQAAYDGLVTATRTWFNWLTGAGFITVNAGTLQSLAGIPTDTASIWATGQRTAMNAAMNGLMRKVTSRAVELWGRDVTLDEVGIALNLP